MQSASTESTGPELVEVLHPGSASLPVRALDPNRLPPALDRLINAISLVAGPNTEIHEASFKRMAEALAPASVAALAADLTCYSLFCRSTGRGGLPAEPELVARYIDHLEEKKMKLATIKRRLASISTMHGLANLESPVRSSLVANTLKAYRRRHGSSQRQAAALRFMSKDASGTPSGNQSLTVEALLNACTADPQGLRDAALISIGYDAGLRVSELVSIEPGHIEPTDEGEGSGILFLPRSKTDQAGEGAYAWLSPDSMRRVGAWLQESGITQGPLFRRIGLTKRHAKPAVAARSIRDLAPNAKVDRARMAARAAEPARTRYHVGEHPLTRQGVAAILRRVGRAAAHAGLTSLAGKELDDALAALSTHSFRVGLTQDLFAAGEDVGPISQALRWRSTATALRYARKLGANSNAAARTLRNIRS